MFHLFYAFIWLITWLPLSILYVFSDVTFLVVYYIVGYRKKVVRSNLSNSFPEKTESELRSIERRYYRYFCDIFIETIYQLHCSNEEILRRIEFKNVNSLTDEYAKGKSVIILTAHYGNWEWFTAFSLVLPPESPMYSVYKQLKNEKFDMFMLKLRAKFSGESIEKRDLIRKMVELKREGKMGMYALISDQTPNARSVHYWTIFLNQDTASIVGAEVLARKFDLPVFYAMITRTKRGHYLGEAIPISLEPRLSPEFEITEKFMRILEKQIQDAPEFWLWSHKRWKLKRPVENQTTKI
jgi:KDO2-lipid IV(A) lauroyltransferase